MNRRMRPMAGLAMVILAVVACGTPAAPSSATSEPSSASTPAPTPTPTAAASASAEAGGEIVESARHRLRLTVPPDWTRIEYDGTWTALDEFGVGVEVPGEDVIDSSALGAFVVMNSMAIPAGMTEADWLAAFDALVQDAITADCPGTAGSGSIGGAPSTTLEQTCGGSRIVGHSLTHAGRGYYVTTVQPVDGDAGAILDELLASIEFLD